MARSAAAVRYEEKRDRERRMATYYAVRRDLWFAALHRRLRQTEESVMTRGRWS